MAVNITVRADAAKAAQEMQNFSRTVSAGMNQIIGRTGVARDGMQALQRVAMLLGTQTAPQLTGSVMLASDAWKTIKGSADLAGLGLTKTSLIIVGITAIIGTGTAALRAHAAAWDEVRSSQKLAAQEGNILQRYTELILDARDAGKISNARADELFGLYGSSDPEKIRQLTAAVRELSIPRDRTEALQKLAEAQSDMSIAALDGFAKEEAEAIRQKDERLKAIDEELAKFKSFQELKSALVDAGRASEINGLDSVAGYRKRLADQADAEFQQRLAAADGKEKERLEAARTQRNQEYLDRYAELRKQIEEETKLRVEAQREQMRADEEFLQRAAQQRAERINRINTDPFTADSDKYQQFLDAGVPKDQLGANPESYFEQMRAGLASLRNEWGTLQQQIAGTFYGAINSSITLVSAGLTDIIFTTEGWRQKLAQIPQQILQGIIGAIIQMGIRWIATQVLMAVAGKSIAAASTAALIPIAMAQASLWNTPAVLATISSYGGAAAAAPLQIAGAVAMSQAIAAGASVSGAAGFKEGGWTGNGGTDQVVGVVHGQEWVMPADTVAAWGHENMAAIQAGPGRVNSRFASTSGTASTDKAAQIQVVNVNDENQLKRFLESSDAAQIVVNHVFKNRGRYGF